MYQGFNILAVPSVIMSTHFQATMVSNTCQASKSQMLKVGSISNKVKTLSGSYWSHHKKYSPGIVLWLLLSIMKKSLSLEVSMQKAPYLSLMYRIRLQKISKLNLACYVIVINVQWSEMVMLWPVLILWTIKRSSLSSQTVKKLL